MAVMSLVAVMTPHTGKIVKNSLRVFERGENLLQNGNIANFVFWFSQSSELELES